MLSPLLFNLVAKGLRTLLYKAESIGLIKGFSVGIEPITISHLQFVDDTLIFCGADLNQVQGIKRLL